MVFVLKERGNLKANSFDEASQAVFVGSDTPFLKKQSALELQVI
jgi:hypothetical protein